MLLFVKIKPNQRFDRVERIAGGWQIRIKAPATEGQANKYLLTFLAGVLEIPSGRISVKRGHASRMKYLEIDAPDLDVERALSNCAGGK